MDLCQPEKLVQNGSAMFTSINYDVIKKWCANILSVYAPYCPAEATIGPCRQVFF